MKPYPKDDTTPGPPSKAVASPCVQVCVVDGASGLCFGCKRTLPEIARWSRFSDQERARILDELPGRTTPF